MRAAKRSVEFSQARKQGGYSIGRAAQFTGVTAKMIRHYEAIGLIPKASRTAGDYRVYTPSDLHTLRFIRRARGLGFSIREIQGLLGLWNNQRRASAEVKRLATQHIAELDQKIQELEAMRATLANLVRHCRGDSRPDCPILDDLRGLPLSG